MPHVNVKLELDGGELEPQIKVDWVRLEMSLQSHHVARVRVVSASKDERGDARSALLDSAFGKLSKPAELTLEPESAGHLPLTLKGLLVEATHERELDGDHAVVLTIASPTILLDSGPRCRIWEEQSAKSIVESVTERLDGVDADLSAFPGTTIPYEAQFEESDFDFLRRMAGRMSLWLYHDGQILRAEKSLPEQGEKVRLSVARDPEIGRLDEFSVTSRIAPAAFLESFQLAHDKESVTATQSEADETRTAHPLVDLARGGSSDVYEVPRHPRPLGEVLDGDLLKDFSKARAESGFASLVEATASTTVPGIRPGLRVAIEGGGGDEDAEYLVVAAAHQFIRQEGYRCDLTMIPVVSAYPPVAAPPAVTALNRAKVMGDYSEDHPGMIRIEYSRPIEESGSRGTPDDSKASTTWARVLTPHGGEDAGFIAMPEIGDEVVVGHLGGRATHPVILGCVFAKDKPGPAFDEIESIPDNDSKVFRTRSGNTFRLTDVGGKETIELRSPDDTNVLRLTMDGPKVELETRGDVIVTADRNVTVSAAGDMTLESDGDMTLACEGKMALKSTGDMKLASTANLKASSNAEMKLSAGSTLKASGTATAELSGAKTAVKGSAMVEVQGALVKIN